MTEKKEEEKLQEQETIEEEAAPEKDAESGGKEDDKGERTFTQAELDATIANRLSRDRKKQAEKYAGFDAIKEKAEKWDAHEVEQMGELEKAQKRIADAEAAAQKASQKAEETLILASVIAEAAKAGAAYPEDTFNLLDKSGITVEDGKVVGVADAVKELVEAGRLVMNKRTAASLDGGKGSGEREKEKKPEATDDEISIARKLNLTPEQYLKGKNK